MDIAGGYDEIRRGTRWIGEDGWVWVSRGGIDAHPASLLKSEPKPDEIHLPKSPGHYLEFIQAVRSRGRTLTPADVALRSATPGWLGQIAMLTGRKITWDPVREEILGDEEASRMLHRRMRAPYQL
jgi:hypothetical protein